MDTNDIRTIAIVGAGQMGSGIAQVFADKQYEVLLSDVAVERAQASKGKIAAILLKQVEKGKLTEAVRSALLERIRPVGPWEGLDRADLVVEATTEDPAAKMDVFEQADRVMRKEAILASNTSSISITRLAGRTKRPERVIGMHFMNPVPLMKLVEIISGVQTSPETTNTARNLATSLGKTVITSKDQPGFMLNRMLIPFLNEACFALQEGLGTPEDIDLAARLGLNHPMGPLELADFIGLDTVLSIAEVLHREFGDDKYRPATLLRNLVAAGWFGRKVGRGFYVYDEKGQKTGRAFER